MFYLPHPAVAPWVENFIEECAAFPNGAHDDQVDGMTQALNQQWGAWDRQSDVIYIYSEYLRRDAEPVVHAEAIRSRGDWIRGVIDAASRGRSRSDGWRTPLQ